jgi:hypothetical protein
MSEWEENWDLRIAGCVIKIAGDDVGGAFSGKLGREIQSTGHAFQGRVRYGL